MLESLRIENLPPVPPDPSNAVADDPRAAELGHRLFFDTRLSRNGQVSCATCHQPEQHFTDRLAKGQAIGTSKRNTRSIVGSQYSPWLYWDGRKDSLWSQALSPLEDPNEHGGNRLQYARLMRSDPGYRAVYEMLFGQLPDLSDRDRFPDAAAPGSGKLDAAWRSMTPRDQELVARVFVNIGKAIAAYERLLMPGASRFDAYVQAVVEGDVETQQALLDETETRGLRLFIGEANCMQCHNGPLFTNNEFHNTGVLSFPGEVPDKGRIVGVRTLNDDPFNCLGAFSEDPMKHCAELKFARVDAPELLGAMRTPSLRNLAVSAPYMHSGQTGTLAEVLEHYNRAPLAMIGHNEAKPLGLSRQELRHLEAFLNTLAAPPASAPEWLGPPDAD